MEPYKAIFLIGISVCYTFSGISNVQATDPPPPPSAPDASPPESSISDVPATAPSPTPTESLTFTAASAPGPSENDINIDFHTVSVSNIGDLNPKLDNVNKFDFTSMKIDTTAKDLCKGTDYNNECLAAILPGLKKRAEEGKRGIEPKDVMRLETESLFKKANATLDFAKRVVEDDKTEMEVKEAMSVCVENYESLISGLEDVKTAMEGGNYGRLESVLSAAISDVATCSDAFVDVPDVESPTKSLDELMNKLLSNILAMCQNVKNT